MKKSTLILFLAFWVCTGTAQTNTPVGADINGNVNPPVIVTNKFNITYPNVSPTWAIDGEYFIAEYRDQFTNLWKSTTYDRFGEFIRAGSEMSDNNYPRPIIDYHTKNYPDENYKIWISTDGNGNKVYYSKLRSDSTIWFDQNGKYTSTQLSTNKNTQQTKHDKSAKDFGPKNNSSSPKKSAVAK